MSSRYASRYVSSSEEESSDEEECSQNYKPVEMNNFSNAPVNEPPRIIHRADSTEEEITEEASEDEASDAVESDRESVKASENGDEICLDDLDIKPAVEKPEFGLAVPKTSSKFNRSNSNASSFAHKVPQTGLDMEELNRKKIEKDLTELQQLINRHFEERKKEEQDLSNLRDRIEKRKKMRAEQIIVRQQRERERRERERLDKIRKEEELKERLEEEERKRKEQMANMSVHFGGYLDRADRQRRGRRGTARDTKKKYLAERRKPLNIDHLNKDKLVEKAQEMFNWLRALEEERYDYGNSVDGQKYSLATLRHRINDLMVKSGKSKPRVGKLKIR